MRKILPLLLGLGILWGQRLSLKQVVLQAVEKNPDILIARYGPRSAENLWKASRSLFVPRFYLTASASRDQQKPSSIFEGRSDRVDTDREAGNVEIVQNLPTGGRVTFSVNQSRNYTTNFFYQLNPSYTTFFQLSLSHPLLKNAGVSVTKQNIILSRANYEKSLLDFRAQVSSVILGVVEAYWNYLYYLEAYRVKEESLRLAQDLYRQNREMVKVGKKSPIDLVEAEAEVETRKAELIEARNQMEGAREDLRLKTGIDLIPEDPSLLEAPRVEREVPDLQGLLQHARAHNPKILAARKEVDRAEFNMKVKSNGLKPELNLQLVMSTIGRAGDRILYKDNNPFSGVVVGKVTGSPYDSVNEALRGAYNSISIQVQYSMPIKRLQEVGEYRAAVAEYYRAREAYRKALEEVEFAIRSAWRDAMAAFQRMKATRKARELAEKKLEAEQVKFSQGASTNYMVLTYQRDLARAKINELKSILDYNIALFRLKKEAGLLLDGFGINF